MHFIKKIVLLLLLAFVSLNGDSPVWKVSDGKNTIFIGGTIHLLQKSDYPLPAAFDYAYSKSSKIFFEVDLEKTKTLEFQEQMSQKLIYHDGKTIKDYISSDTYNLLDNYFAKKGMNFSKIIHLKAPLIIMTMSTIELEALGFTDNGVDDFFNKKSIKDKKYIGELESVNDQINFLATMGEGEEDKFIVYSLKDLKNTSQMMDDIKHMWLNGNTKDMQKSFLLPMKKEFPNIYNNLLTKRNNKWMLKIKKMFTTKDVEFILVGFMHVVGEDGLLQQLKRDGYKIEMIN